MKMKILGANQLIFCDSQYSHPQDAVDSAFEESVKDPKNYIYAIRSEGQWDRTHSR